MTKRRGPKRGDSDYRHPVIAEREYAMLEMLVKGATMREIGESYGVSPNVASRAVRDALARRSIQLEKITVNVARALILDRLELMTAKMMPLATGDLTGVPDIKAFDSMLNALKLAAQLQNVPLSGGRGNGAVEINQTNTTLVAVEQMRDTIMTSLDQVADRAQVIEGTLTTAATNGARPGLSA